jgi:hypothetical protein
MTEKTYIIPVWAICAIAYGDYTGLSKYDIIGLDAFLESLDEDGFWSWGKDEYFSRENDINSLGCTVVDAAWIFSEKTKEKFK